MARYTKCKKESFSQTVNRIRSIRRNDLLTGNENHFGFCRWEWQIYDLIVLQEKLKKEFDSVKTKMKEAIEDGDDF